MFYLNSKSNNKYHRNSNTGQQISKKTSHVSLQGLLNTWILVDVKLHMNNKGFVHKCFLVEEKPLYWKSWKSLICDVWLTFTLTSSPPLWLTLFHPQHVCLISEHKKDHNEFMHHTHLVFIKCFNTYTELNCTHLQMYCIYHKTRKKSHPDIFIDWKGRADVWTMFCVQRWMRKCLSLLK